MQISADDRSEHYWPLKFHSCPLVTVNGYNPLNVLYADDVEGIVIAIRYDKNGVPHLDEFRGRVCIEEKPHYCRTN